GYTATKPADPSSETLPAPFSFWATSATATTAFSFATPITRDITLYAVCGAATAATSFSGTVEQFLATEFANTSSNTSPYPITITGVTNANLASILSHLGEFSVLDDDGNYTKELYSNLTLSGDGLTEIPDYCFMTGTGNYSLSKIMAINLPDSVTKIGNNAFYGMRQLASITLPSNLEEIGEYAFSVVGCDSGVGFSTTLPASVNKIYANAFLNADLTSLTVEGTNSWWQSVPGTTAGQYVSLSVSSFFDTNEVYER
ncbi:MAG: leucine-rich repeat domain-containing protein, partial [Treponema sp.]|nr:leucine-rich repeat domain-containing protein [Treponema sp.]